MTNDTNLAVAAAAVSAAGPMPDNLAEQDAWRKIVRRNLAFIVETANSKTLTELLTSPADTKQFVGTVISVQKHERSQRGFVVFQTGTERVAKTMDGSTELPLGQEAARTHRFDDADSGGRELARHLRDNLIGHRVMVHITMEVTSGDASKKVRIVTRVDDLGVDPEYRTEG